MTEERPLVASHVVRSGCAWRAGIRKGDEIVSVNGTPIRDEVDFRFETAQSFSMVVVRRRGRIRAAQLQRNANAEVGIAFADAVVACCSNHCIFCFIDQMPPGLRASLYIKDEDARHSFVNGNYVTLAAMTWPDLDRLCSQGLSPLYVSVHATDSKIRQRMLGNNRIGDILEQLRFLEKNGIRFHAQIVVCPGINNGAVLMRSLRDLCNFTTGMLSVAVVPVGLTKFRKRKLAPVDAKEATRICAAVSLQSDRDMRKNGGIRRIFLADELFLKAKLPLPPRRYYRDYPQIENGVGLVRTLLDEWAAIKRNPSRPRAASVTRSVVIVTSESAYPFLARIGRWLSQRISKAGVATIAVHNEFFGGGVTVAGLLTARDLIRDVRAYDSVPDMVVIPSVMLNRLGRTLDGYSVKRIGKSLGARVVAAATIDEIIRCL
jgi:putative radical SAM enzyme (TIGR03279 family)